MIDILGKLNDLLALTPLETVKRDLEQYRLIH